MRLRRKILVVLLFVAVGISAGCRSGPSAHGHSLSMFLVPIYKQPVGFSSTYKEHLTMTAPVAEYTVGEVSDETLQPIAPKVERSTAPSDKVIFPEPCGPECRRPPAEGQKVSVRSTPRSTPIRNRVTKHFELIKPQ